ncbi:MAG: hypothetical protein ABEJ61_05575 [Haloferacaceae archaeon]
MAQKLQSSADVPTVDDEAHLEFIDGFPCTHFFCHGVLEKGTHGGRPAVACSTCDRVYYVLADG